MEGTLLGVKLMCPVVTNEAFAMWLFSNYFEDLLACAIVHMLLFVCVTCNNIGILPSYC